MKKILIVGAISDFGGREIEVKNIINALSEKYNVRLFSTVPMTKESIVFTGKYFEWNTIHKKLNNSHLVLRTLSYISKVVNKSNLPSYLLVDNKISRLFFNFKYRNVKNLQDEVDNADAVLFCGVLDGSFLNEITEYCAKTKKPILFRTTGTITIIPDNVGEILSLFSFIIVHSKINSIPLRNFTSDNIKIIDQTTLQERDLLNLPLEKTTNLKFGYLGRFSAEKGILELIDGFQECKRELIIGGKGPFLQMIEEKCNENPFLQYVGEISADKISDFFARIDCLIIPSFEDAGPLVGIEAMAAGKIILSTKVGAMMERLNQTTNQFWFDINNKDSLLKEISIIANKSEEEILNIRENLRDRYLNAYSEKTISNQYMDLFDEAFQNIKN